MTPQALPGAARRPVSSLRRHLRNVFLFLAAALVVFAAASRLELDPLVRGVAVLAIGLALIRLAGLVLFRAALPAAGVATPRIVEEVALLLAYVAWGMLRLRTAGLDLAQLVTTSAVITAVVAFAMQDTLGNVLSGLFLELDRSIKIGDWVRLDDLSGRVVEIRWRHTAIRTRNGELAIVPNAALMKARFLVIPQAEHDEGRWRRWVWFDVDFDVPAARVIAAARRAVLGAEIQNVAREPAPDCVLMELALGQARYALRYWLLDPRHDDGTDSAVRMHLLAA
ncbi:MAG: mechanosensitive ion channel family protein, partial [Clostridia bacterium]